MRGATLRQLRAFSLVARQHSFAQAAAELHLTPSAVSLQIKELEQCVGVPLFGRGGKGVALTPAGELLLVDVHRALAALQHADEAIAKLSGRSIRSVKIGMVSNAKYFLPRLLAGYHERERDVELQLTVGNREHLLELLRRGQVDLAVMGMPPDDLHARAEIFAVQPLGIVASPQHPLVGEELMTAEALADEEFIVREAGSGTRAAMDRFFAEAQVVPRCAMEITSNEAIKQAVMADMGLAFMSLHTVGMELQAGLLSVVQVVGLPMLRHWYVVNMARAATGGAAEALRRFVLEHGGRAIERQFEREAPAKPASARASPGE